MSEWYDIQKQSSSKFRKLLQERIGKTNARRKLRAEEAKRLAKLEAIAENTLKVHGLKLSDCMVDTMTDWHSETLCKYFCHNTARCSKRRKNVLFIPLTNL